MNNAIHFLDDIQSSFKKMKIVTIASATMGVLVAVITTLGALWYVKSEKNQIYVINEGTVLEAYRSDNLAQRDLEADVHLKRFHELFFNIAPNETMIEKNMEKAFHLADKSAYSYYRDLNERKYFSRLIDIQATQQIDVDSVVVNMNVYPYKADTYGNLYIIRESNITRYDFHSNCELSEVTRTKQNPNGLLIQNFSASFDKGETRSRRGYED